MVMYSYVLSTNRQETVENVAVETPWRKTKFLKVIAGFALLVTIAVVYVFVTKQSDGITMSKNTSSNSTDHHGICVSCYKCLSKFTGTHV